MPFHSLLTFCHWHTVQHKLCGACCLSVCIEPCAHRAGTLVAILLLNSEWHRHCRKERDRIKRERCPAAGSGPDIVHKEILGISFKHGSEACIIFDPGSTGAEYIWLLAKAKSVSFQQTCYTTGMGTLSCRYLQQRRTSRLSFLLFSLQLEGFYVQNSRNLNL